MPIAPRPPVPGPVNFDYPHGDDFAPPPHLIKQTPFLEADPGLVPDIDIDTSYDRSDILATEPVPTVRPIFIGLRRALASRQVEQSNDQLQGLARKHRVARYVGESILTGRLYNDAEVDGHPNLDRPSSREEIRAAEKLDKIATKRRRVGAHAHAKSHNLTAPVSARRSETKHARHSNKQHDRAHRKLSRLDERFSRVISQPARKAARVTARRNRAVARLEAFDRAAR